MTFTVSLLAPQANPNVTLTAGRSGNSYTSDAYGVLHNVVPQDAWDLGTAGCLSLGQSGGRNNYAATVLPNSANDISQDYAVGSRWLVPAAGKEYVCTVNTLANAVWAALN